VLAKVSFTMSEKDPAIRVTKAVAGCYSSHKNMRLMYINGKPRKAVEHLVSVIRPATLKTLIESKLEMDKSKLKKVFCRPDQCSLTVIDILCRDNKAEGL
jgi:hypothetical protein